MLEEKKMNKRGSNQYRIKTGKTQQNFVLMGTFLIGVAALFGGVTYYKATHPLFLNPCADGCKAEEITHITVSYKDVRAQRLYEDLKKANSPMAGSAGTFIQMADKYGLDWTLMPAIAFKESSLGKHIANDFNPFGMTTGLKTGPRFRAFSSWEDAIETEAKLLSGNYRMNSNMAIGSKYCPASECSDNWAETVTNYSLALVTK